LFLKEQIKDIIIKVARDADSENEGWKIWLLIFVGCTSDDDDDDVFYLFLQKQK
jgi:hypothetical protein